MRRRTYSCLAIARRHGRLFAALHRNARDRADVRDGGDGRPVANAAMRAEVEMDAALAALRRGA